MNRPKRIAVLIPAVTDSTQESILGGIYSVNEKLGYDTLVFTNASNQYDDYEYTPYIRGEENIYSLAFCADICGIILVSNYFNSKNLLDSLTAKVWNSGLPCVTIERETGGLPCVFAPQYESIYDVTEHLITAHGCRRLYCLTGPDGNVEAEERLSGFRDAITAHGLPFDESHVFYGDFWIYKPRELGEKILDGSIEAPDAVVCANDHMAAALCDTLQAGGISIPDDIKITGYDGHRSALLHFPTITTIFSKHTQVGQLSAIKLHELMTGEKADFAVQKQSMITGASCGCTQSSLDTTISMQRVQKLIDTLFERKQVSDTQMDTNFLAKMLWTDSLSELVCRADELAYVIPYWDTLSFCLCDDWLGTPEQPDSRREVGYSKTMRLVLSKDRNCVKEKECDFSTALILPALQKPHEPRFYVITPLHCSENALGYCAASYGEGKNYCVTPLFVSWCDAFANGLRSLQKKMYTDWLVKKMDAFATHDLLTKMFNKNGFIAEISDAEKYSAAGYALLLITYKRVMSSSDSGTGDVNLPLANAIQLICNVNELSARVQENVFAVLLQRADNEDAESCAERWILRLEKLMRGMQSDARDIRLPELVYDCHSLEANDMAFLDKQLFMLSVKLEASDNGHGNFTEQFNRIHREIHLYPQNDYTVQALARELGISMGYFQRIYRLQFGVSCLDDIIAARIKLAKKLLAKTNLSVQGIAEQCGYKNASHFMRQFKSKTGLTAIEYRRSHNEVS